MLMLSKIADFDPEADGAAAEEESGSEEDEDVAGTEHYVSVGYVPLNPTDNFFATVTDYLAIPTARANSVKKTPPPSAQNTPV